MDPRIEAALEEWRIRACDPGYAGLNALADAEFTGAVTVDRTVGFMVNGRLVGMEGGTTEAFWGADFTALEASGPALPLLCAMLTSDAQEEGEYYTGETAISDVDETLSSGGFTGYLELSENVFSGDYFIVYYGGTSFSTAFLGKEDRIITGAEAQERAAEEVGIFTVHSVSIDVIEIPAPDVDDSASPDAPSPDAVDAEPVDEQPTVHDTPDQEQDIQEIDDPDAPEHDGSTSSETARLARAALGADPTEIGRGRSQPTSATDTLATIPALDPATSRERDAPTSVTESESTDSSTPTEPDQRPTPESESTPKVAELEAALEDATAENDRLRDRIEELETVIAEMEAEEETGQSLDAAVALDGTNLFVRYHTQATDTLSDALAGTTSRADVKDNIQLERHTTFDTTDLMVEGQSFDDFLKQTTAYTYSEWLLTELLFEIIDSGEEKDFAGLVDVIPEIDRIEFNGEVPVHSKAAEERKSDTYAFDLVCRNSMGDPVLVAEVHDDRSPVTGDAVGQLLSDVNQVTAERASLGGAFFVSKSYFEPAALETVADATGGSLLRGGSKQSYVSVSRKNGFHFCLVEARSGSFHLSIPD